MVAAFALAAATHVAAAAPAAAHASFVAATPSPGSALPQAPGAVVLTFTEPLNRQLSRVEVRDRDGRDVGDGATRPVPNNPSGMQRKLGLLRPGVYTVRWTTVSTLDGHRLTGTYSFGIGTAASDAQTVGAGAVASEGVAGIAARFLAVTGLVLWAGLVLLRRRAAEAGVPQRALAILAHAAPGAAALGTAVSVAVIVARSGSSLSDLPDAFASQSGSFRAMLLGASAAGAILGPRMRDAHPFLAGTALVAEGAAGHAAGSPAPAVATVSFAVHLGAIGAWLFAVVAGLVTRPVRPVLAALTPYAVAAAGALAVTGMLNAALELSHPGQLATTGYGRALVVKTAVLVVMAALGATHYWLRRRAVPEPVLRRPLRLEAGAAAIGLVAAAVLVATPNPPREAEATSEVAGSDPVLAHLADYDAVSVAEASGEHVVAVTVIPPRPGRVELRVTVVGATPDDRVADPRLVATSPAGAPRTVELEGCGEGCFTGRGHLDTPGSWSFRFMARATATTVEATVAVPVPAPSARQELARTIEAMEQLESAAMTETLRARTDDAPLVARYRFAAPNAFEIRVNDRHEIVVGRRSFRRQPGSPQWEAGTWPVSYRWPHGYYREYWKGATAVRLLGTDTVDGAATRIIGFVRPDLPAWFRVYVDDAGRVRRQEMLASGHLMRHDYRDLGTAGPISPPA